ncbi:hypothetical protein MUP05_06850 [Candidatus Bathyarchaeota archaeon]|nr:hypothetical protein [Candidatus Bathyarchaeota archaeon]
MNTEPDRIDIHNRKHRFDLALRNLEQDPSICPENKQQINKFVAFCRANNLSLERQLIYLQKPHVAGQVLQGSIREGYEGFYR